MAQDAPVGEAFDRHIALEGAVNFRDLGGYPAADGRTVRWRSLFRADGLSNLTPPDHAIVRQLGIATVIDLRSPGELDAGTFPVEDIPVQFHHVPLVTELPDPELFRQVPGFVPSHYQDIVRQSGTQIARALSIVAELRSHPVIVHCAAGKDRTGVLITVILALLGVDDDTIAADYALSAGSMQALRDRLLERHPEFKERMDLFGDVMLSAPPEYITDLLAMVRDEYGSVEGYVGAHGAGPDVVASLRATLLA